MVAKRLWILGVLLSTIVAGTSALSLYPRVRAVDIVALFGGGFGAGAGLVGAIRRR